MVACYITWAKISWTYSRTDFQREFESLRVQRNIKQKKTKKNKKKQFLKETKSYIFYTYMYINFIINTCVFKFLKLTNKSLINRRNIQTMNIKDIFFSRGLGEDAIGRLDKQNGNAMDNIFFI